MGRTKKVAVTVDQEVLGAAERLRKRTGESRSALVNRALRLLLSEQEHRLRVAEYVAAYRAHPESDAEVAAARETAATALEGVDW